MQNRSPRFPFLPLEEAIHLLRKLDVVQKDRSRPLKRPEILKALDFGSFHGVAAKTIASLRAYDLLEKNGNGLSISATGASLLDAETEAQRLPLARRAALSPLAFRRLWRKSRHASEAEIADLFVSRGFTANGVARAAEVYRRNDEFAALATLDSEPDLPERGPGNVRKQGKQKLEKRASPPASPASSSFLRLPLSTGVAAIPKGIDEEEFTLLMQTLRTWKKQLVAS